MPWRVQARKGLLMCFQWSISTSLSRFLQLLAREEIMSYEKIDFSRVDWHRILPALGVDEKFIVHPKKRGPCPIEQAGTTRFRFDNKEGRGTWVCNCGAGDGVRLVALVHGVSDAEAIQMIREVIGNSSVLKTAPVKVI